RTPPATSSTSRWREETVRSSTTTSFSAARPTVALSFPSAKSRRGPGRPSTTAVSQSGSSRADRFTSTVDRSGATRSPDGDRPAAVHRVRLQVVVEGLGGHGEGLPGPGVVHHVVALGVLAGDGHVVAGDLAVDGHRAVDDH